MADSGATNTGSTGGGSLVPGLHGSDEDSSQDSSRNLSGKESKAKDMTKTLEDNNNEVKHNPNTISVAKNEMTCEGGSSSSSSSPPPSTAKTVLVTVTAST